MAIKESFTKGFTALNLKTNTFMEESKAKTYISTLEKDIEKLKLDIGEKTYYQHKNSVDLSEEINKMVQEIDQKMQEIDAQHQHIKQIQEENEKVLGNNMQQAPVIDANVVFCQYCGNKNAANYKFCNKCGKPL